MISVEVIATLLERAAALVVRGHAGIGKSALLAQASCLATCSRMKQ